MDNFLKAVYQKDNTSIKEMVVSGVDVNILDSDGRTALMHAVLDFEADTSIVLLLLELGVNINVQDEGQKWSALHFAARDNKKEVVSVLLKSGASVDLLDCFGNTALWRAVMSFNGDSSIVNELLSYGANPTIKNESGISPLSLAESMGKIECLKLLETKALV